MNARADLGLLILNALGIDPKNVASVRIYMAPNQPSTVTVVRAVYADEQAAIVESVKLYRLEPTE